MRLLLFGVVVLSLLASSGCAGSGIAEDFGARYTSIALLLSAGTLWGCAFRFNRRVPFTLFLLVSVAACTAQAAPLDHDLLLDVICHRESRSENIPMLAISDGGKSRGECSIQIETARMVRDVALREGLVDKRIVSLIDDDMTFPVLLHLSHIQRGFGKAFLIWMERGSRTRPPIRGVARMAYAWNGGPYSDYGSRPDALAFSREVGRAYREAQKARAMASYKGKT